MESIENEIARLQVELQVATEKESRLKRDLQVAETMDKAVIEAKMKTRKCICCHLPKLMDNSKYSYCLHAFHSSL